MEDVNVVGGFPNVFCCSGCGSDGGVCACGDGYVVVVMIIGVVVAV